MHELPVIKSVLDICLKHAEKNGARKIVTVELKVGELSDLEPEWMQKYFNFVAKDTIAEDATLKIERTPLVMRCEACSESFPVNIKAMKEISCPHCKGKNLSYVSGREYRVENMEVL
jgi:hydrogenase nickel incorporation protein HypA/HybF